MIMWEMPGTCNLILGFLRGRQLQYGRPDKGSNQGDPKLVAFAMWRSPAD